MFPTRGSDKPSYPSFYQPSFFADKQPLSQENDEDIEGGVLVSRKTLSDLPILPATIHTICHFKRDFSGGLESGPFTPPDIQATPTISLFSIQASLPQFF